MLVSGILSCGACALCFLLDTLPTCDPDMLTILVAEGWPRGLACVAMLSSVLSALICHVSAAIRFRRDGFVWQPFRGDLTFVRLQACGWTLFAVVVMVQLVLAFSSSRLLVSSVQMGIFSVVGIAAVVAQWLLVSSVRMYADSAAAAHKARKLDGSSPTAGARRTVSSSRDDGGGIRVSLPPGKDGCKENTNRVTTVALIICCLGCTCLADYLRASAYVYEASVLFGIGAGAAVFGCLNTHCICGAGNMRPQGYSIFQPFQGGARFVLLQGIGWAMGGVGVLTALTILSVGLSEVRVDGALVATGALFAAANVLLLVSLSFFDARQAGMCGMERAVIPAIDDADMHSKDRSPWQQQQQQQQQQQAGNETAQITVKIGWLNRLLLWLGLRSSPVVLEDAQLVSVLMTIAAAGIFVLLDCLLILFGPSFPILPALVVAVVVISSTIPLSLWMTRARRYVE